MNSSRDTVKIPCATTRQTTSTDDSSGLIIDNAAVATPQNSRGTAEIQGPVAPPPTPTDYEIMTESCDWCMAETPWDDALFGNENEDVTETVSAANTQTTPPTKQEVPQVSLLPRQALGIPMM